MPLLLFCQSKSKHFSFAVNILPSNLLVLLNETWIGAAAFIPFCGALQILLNTSSHHSQTLAMPSGCEGTWESNHS